MSVRCRTYALHPTLAASWPPTRSGELFNCKHPDNRPVYAERAVRLARIRTPSGSCQPCAPNCLKLPFTSGTGRSAQSAQIEVPHSAIAATGHGWDTGTTANEKAFLRIELPLLLRVVRCLPLNGEHAIPGEV
jgi:hypothetical protein